MSTPRRPLPPEIYMRRRVAALVIVLLLVAGLIGAWAALRGGREDTTAAVSTTSSVVQPAVTSEAPSATEEPALQPPAEETSAQSQPPATSEEAVAPTEEPKGTCELNDLKITATTDKSSYAGGVQPVFYMSVENPTGADCRIDLDAEVLRFEVYNLATNERMWSDTDCHPSVQAGQELFKAGETRHFEATWSRLGSAPEQCQNRPETPAGSYYLHAVIGQHASPATTFNLR